MAAQEERNGAAYGTLSLAVAFLLYTIIPSEVWCMYTFLYSLVMPADLPVGCSPGDLSANGSGGM